MINVIAGIMSFFTIAQLTRVTKDQSKQNHRILHNGIAENENTTKRQNYNTN